ncbi:MAG: sugar phosphate isomerase/epimerase [Proteobacteria bacterium]|nr:sugar phosphate isomerase/epimerase [Pseudomonadota bacterium]
MYLALPESYKKKYPFKIGTTSYIYPDHMIPNVKMLAPYLDEIELLFFESIPPGSIPAKNEIKALHEISKEHGITYNIHLPTDIFSGSSDDTKRLRFVDTIVNIIDLTKILSPSTYTLHLSYPDDLDKTKCDQIWLNNVYDSMKKLMKSGVNSKSISIETLEYPFEWIAGVISDFNLSVCIDAGHLILNGYDAQKVFKKYLDITAVIHLHGVKNGRDHQSLDKLSYKELETLINLMHGFTGTLSVEVFSFENLLPSLQCFNNCYQSFRQTDS